MRSVRVPLQVFFSTQFMFLHFFVMSLQHNNAFASCVSGVLSTFASVLFCLPGPRDQRQIGTNALSRSSLSILLLALCTACAIRMYSVFFQVLFCIRVTMRLLGFARINFCVRLTHRPARLSLVCTLPVLLHCQLHTCCFSDTSSLST